MERSERPEASTVSKAPMEHNAKLSKKRRVKKADLEAGFFFIIFLGVD
jgi:hypothetical protein